MNRSHDYRISVAPLRPWPFGPPLRGRAPGRYADPLVANPKVGQSARVQALAPVGGLAWSHST